MSIKLDLNNPSFQDRLFGLEPAEASQLFGSLRKLRKMDWQQVYRDKGLNWERIHSRLGESGERLYSIRITKKFRAVVYRERDIMRFVSLHPDHDSAYK